MRQRWPEPSYHCDAVVLAAQHLQRPHEHVEALCAGPTRRSRGRGEHGIQDGVEESRQHRCARCVEMSKSL